MEKSTNESCSTWNCSTWFCSRHKGMMSFMMIIMVLVVIAWVWFYLKESSNKANEKVENVVQNSVIETPKIVETQSQTNTNIENTKPVESNEESTKTELSKWQYMEYSKTAVENAKWKIVLFFHATWCPTCKFTDEDILSKWVPDNLTILKVDYDTSTDLKSKYSVLSQSTYVQIDKNWNEINKWTWVWVDWITSWVK